MNDYISREAVLSKCADIWNNADETTQTGVDTINAIDRITDFIEAMPASDVQPVKWISVDEALPIYDGLVLAIDKNNTVRLCIYTEFGWLSQYGNPMIAHITHWQPLPEPPKDGDIND